MNEPGKHEYLRICIRFRLLSIILSTFAYLILLPGDRHSGYIRFIVAIGMLTACLVGTLLYKRLYFETDNKVWLLVTLSLELGAYGIFILLSGGLISPYLWYFAGCLFLMAAARRYRLILILATIWCLICILSGVQYRQITYSDINTAIGILIVAGGFYALQVYISRLEFLNQRLDQEKEATKQALSQITNLYDTVNLFTITSRQQIMDEMAGLITRTISPEGCLLLKLKIEAGQNIESLSSCGIASSIVPAILEELERLYLENEKSAGDKITVDGRSYQIHLIGRGILLPGILVLPVRREDTPLSKSRQEMAQFYFRMIDTVLKNMDVQKSVEDGIIREEQHRIACEIHDTVIQKLFGIACSLKVLESQFPDSDSLVKSQLTDIERSTRLTMQELREAIYGLRFECNNEAFIEKLSLYMNEAGRLSSSCVNLESSGDSSILTIGQKTAIYRIACEAVNNAIRHGKADQINVALHIGSPKISLVISDNGSGFQPSALSRAGSGLKNMYQTATLMKGTFSIDTHRGKGTRIDVCLPN